jgi:hypothetical protein
LLTETDSGRPSSIDLLASAATQYLGFLAGGSTNLPAPLVKLQEGGSSSVDYRSEKPRFGGDMWDPRNRPNRGVR